MAEKAVNGGIEEFVEADILLSCSRFGMCVCKGRIGQLEILSDASSLAHEGQPLCARSWQHCDNGKRLQIIRNNDSLI